MKEFKDTCVFVLRRVMSRVK